MNLLKIKVFLLSLLVGFGVTFYPAYSANFSSESLTEWFMNALFVTAVVGFIGMKFFGKNEPRRRK